MALTNQLLLGLRALRQAYKTIPYDHMSLKRKPSLDKCTSLSNNKSTSFHLCVSLSFFCLVSPQELEPKVIQGISQTFNNPLAFLCNQHCPSRLRVPDKIELFIGRFLARLVDNPSFLVWIVLMKDTLVQLYLTGTCCKMQHLIIYNIYGDDRILLQTYSKMRTIAILDNRDYNFIQIFSTVVRV